MAFLIALPFLLIALVFLFAMLYSLIFEKDKPLLLKEKYREEGLLRRYKKKH